MGTLVANSIHYIESYMSDFKILDDDEDIDPSAQISRLKLYLANYFNYYQKKHVNVKISDLFVMQFSNTLNNMHERMKKTDRIKTKINYNKLFDLVFYFCLLRYGAVTGIKLPWAKAIISELFRNKTDYTSNSSLDQHQEIELFCYKKQQNKSNHTPLSDNASFITHEKFCQTVFLCA